MTTSTSTSAEHQAQHQHAVSSTANPKHSARLVNPTTYHLQQQSHQMRFKDQVGIDPTQVMDHQHLFFAHQEHSPNLSDMDYSDLTTTTAASSVTGIPSDLQQQHLVHTDGYNVYDAEHAPSAAAAAQHRHRYYAGHNTAMYYPPATPSVDPAQHGYYYKQQHNASASSSPFAAASAPAHIGYNHMQHPSLVGHSVTPNDAAAMVAAAAAEVVSTASTMAPDRVITGMDHHQHHQGVYGHVPPPTSVPAGHPAGTDGAAAADNGANLPYEDDLAAQANLQAIMEKRRRRRESHNAVERRRRDNINDRIQDLGQLLPDSMTAEEGGVSRLNKGTILRKSVDQIKMLESELRSHQRRVRQLEDTLRQLTMQQQQQQQQQQTMRKTQR